MLVTLGLMIASYCIARLMLVTLQQPPGQTRTAAVAVGIIAVLGCLALGYFAVELLKAADNAWPLGVR